MTAKMPRSHLRMKPEDLLPGEHGIITQFAAVIDTERRVYIRKDSQIHGVWGQSQDQPSHYHGDLLIKRQDNGKFLLVVSERYTGYSTELSSDEYKNLIPVDEIRMLGPDEVECETCKGRGYYYK